MSGKAPVSAARLMLGRCRHALPRGGSEPLRRTHLASGTKGWHGTKCGEAASRRRAAEYHDEWSCRTCGPFGRPSRALLVK